MKTSKLRYVWENATVFNLHQPINLASNAHTMQIASVNHTQIPYNNCKATRTPSFFIAVNVLILATEFTLTRNMELAVTTTVHSTILINPQQQTLNQ